MESPWSTLYSSELNFFRYLLRLRRYERKSFEVGVFRRGWVTFGEYLTGKGASPTNQFWRRKTRVTAVSCGIKISAVHHLVLSQYTHRTDRRTDGQQTCDSKTVRCIKSKVHYASWSETCSLARASEQVSDRFVGVYDKLTTFSGRKTCFGQDSAITTCRDSASRFATGSLCFCRDSQMDFRKRPDVRTCSTLL